MTSKAKYILGRYTFLGGGWQGSEGHGPTLGGAKFFEMSFPHFKTSQKFFSQILSWWPQFVWSHCKRNSKLIIILIQPLISCLLWLSSFLQWKGSGGLKRSENINGDDAKVNMQLADNIVDNPVMNKWYGTYPIADHGVFIINRVKAKMLLARKLSQERKPSAYKRKVQHLQMFDNSLAL